MRPVALHGVPRRAHPLDRRDLLPPDARPRVPARGDAGARRRSSSRIASRQITAGRRRGGLQPEPLSTDLENHYVDSVSGPDRGGARGCSRSARVWSSTGYPAHARARARARAVDRPTRCGPRSRARRSGCSDGSLFVPDELAAKQTPFDRLTASRDGSYWNLVMPYAFASGWFPAHSRAARGIVRYLLAHGARLLGVPRTYARTVYGNAPGAGLAQVYGLERRRASSPTTTSPTSSCSASTGCSPPA